MTDAELAAQAARGDARAFGELVSRHASQVRRLTRAILRNPADADDAAQDGLLAAWRAVDRYDPARPFGPWLSQIVVNAARDLWRRRRVRSTDEIPVQTAGGSSPDSTADRELLKARLREALFELPERQRIAVTLFDAEGYSHRDIGGILGIPEGTVRSEVFHARRRLRELLGPIWEEWK